jgi:hypothetical protein
MKLPSISVKAKHKDMIQICWPHNVGHNIFESGYLRIGEDKYGWFDNRWLDIYSQYKLPTKTGVRKHYNRKMVGNVNLLSNWKDSLPEHPIQVPIPIFSTLNQRYHIPLFLLEGTSCSININIRSSILDLIRIRVRNGDGDWEFIQQKDNREFAGFLTTEHEEFQLPTPSVKAKYGMVTQSEIDIRKKRENVVYVPTVKSFSVTNNGSYGETQEINIDSNSPIMKMYWLAENMNSTKYNNMSNYTTSIHNNLENGHSPIGEVGLKIGTHIKYSLGNNYDFSSSIPFFEAESLPSEEGYNMISFAQRNSIYFSGGIVPDTFSGMTLQIKLKNTNYQNEIKREEEEDEEKGKSPLEILSERKRKQERGETEKTEQVRFRTHVYIENVTKINYGGGGSSYSKQKWEQKAL